MKRIGVVAAVMFITLYCAGCAVPLMAPQLIGAALYGTQIAHVAGGGVETKPFENSTLPDPIQIPIQSVAIVPKWDSDGLIDKGFAEWAKKSTKLKVVTPAEFAKRIDNTVDSSLLTEDEKIQEAIAAGKKLGVETVIFGEVKDEGTDIGLLRSFTGQKDKVKARCKVCLISVKEGRAIWKDELPYAVKIGTKMPTKEEVGKIITEKITGRFQEVILGQKPPTGS